MGPTGSARILQVHPTRRCNLQCLHCYSLSGPAERETLEIALLQGALNDAAGEGYDVLSVSGGEPLLYGALRDLLAHAHSLGMLTTVTSNGMLLDERRIATLRGVLDLLAISLDGVPASHNRMRASPRAFEVMASRLAGVRRAGIPFGFIFTLTQYNVNELAWVADFAVEQGARLLQIHPLEEVGRAAIRLPGERPDGTESAFAFLEAWRIREQVGDRLQIQLDLTHQSALRSHPELVFAGEEPPDTASLPLAEVVSPLVIEPDGTVVPLQYGFSRAHALGRLQDAPLRDLGRRWLTARYPAFRAVCRRVLEEMTADSETPLANWYERLAEHAAAAPIA